MEQTNEIFFEEEIKHPKQKLSRLFKGKLLIPHTLIAFVNDGDRLEILSSKLFLQKYYRKQKYEVVGLFKNEDTAFEYVRCLTELSYKQFGDFNQREAVKNIPISQIKEIFLKED